ncbi:MAG: thioredoxin-dependent thiol peroxidase [Phycisphaerales bacterium]
MPLIEPGKKAPAFSAKDQDGQAHRLSDLAGKPIVLYFYPKDDTSGCTKEACAFRDLQPDFSKVKAAVLGVSPDDEKSHRKFVDKHELNFTLLADVAPEGGEPAICAKYGVWQEKSMYGRKYMGVVRTTYLIDAAGKVARRWDNVKVPGHAEEVLAAVKALGKA